MHDPWFYTHVEASQHLLLDNRAKYIATICAEHKARCDDLLKNKTIEAIVLGPIYALYISRENRLANKRRAADNIEAKALKQEKRREALERGEKEAEDVTPAEKPKRARRSRQSAQQPKATRITGGNKRSKLTYCN